MKAVPRWEGAPGSMFVGMLCEWDGAVRWTTPLQVNLEADGESIYMNMYYNCEFPQVDLATGRHREDSVYHRAAVASGRGAKPVADDPGQPTVRHSQESLFPTTMVLVRSSVSVFECICNIHVCMYAYMHVSK